MALPSGFVIRKPDDETEFRSWYAKQATSLGLSPDPDDPLHYYDWRAAYRSGATADASGHWPSQFKREGHPNLVIDGVDTRTGQPVSPPSVRPPAGFLVRTNLLDREGKTGADVKRRAQVEEPAEEARVRAAVMKELGVGAPGSSPVDPRTIEYLVDQRMQMWRDGVTQAQYNKALGIEAGTGALEGLTGMVGVAADATYDMFVGAPIRNTKNALKTLRGEPLERSDLVPSMPVTSAVIRSADAARNWARKGTGVEHVDTGVAGAALRAGIDIAMPGPEGAMFARAAAKGTTKLAGEGAERIAREGAGAARVVEPPLVVTPPKGFSIRKVPGKGPDSPTVRYVPDPGETPEPHVQMGDGRDIPVSEYEAMLRDPEIMRIDDPRPPMWQEGGEPLTSFREPNPEEAAFLRMHQGVEEGVPMSDAVGRYEADVNRAWEESQAPIPDGGDVATRLQQRLGITRDEANYMVANDGVLPEGSQSVARLRKEGFLDDLEQPTPRMDAEFRRASITEAPPVADAGARSAEPPPTQPPTPPPASSGGPRDPIAIMREALRDAKVGRKAQEDIYTRTRIERMRNAQEARSAAGGGEAGFQAELKALSGEMDKVEFEALRSKIGQEDVDALFNMAAEHPKLRRWESVSAQDGLRNMLEGRVPPENQLKLMRTVYGEGLTKELLDKRPTFARLKESGLQIANIPRALMSSIDLSGPFRQGVFMVSRKQFWANLRPMLKAFGSEEAYKATEDAIRNSPNFDLMHDSGLAITDLEGLASREESFATSLAERMPVVEGSGPLRTPARVAAKTYNATIGRGVRASGRAYTAFLTKLRADVFDDLIAKAKAAGLDPEATTRSAYANFRDAKPNTLAQDMARFINAGTGRGDLPQFLRGAAPVLNAVFFSPKLMASRIQLMNPLFYAKLDPFVRKEAMKSAAGFIAFGSSILALGAMAGADVGTNPYSSDFGKIKVGDTRVDVWGGFQQYVRMMAQIGSGKYVSATSGKEYTLGEGYKPLTRYDIAMRQIESKEAPVFSFITTMLRQKDYAGQPVIVTNEIAKRLTPLYVQSIVELAKEDPKLLPLAVPAVFGVGVQTFETRPSKDGSVKSSAPSGSGAASSVKPSASLDPYGHDAAIMNLRARVPPGSSPEMTAQVVASARPVYIAPDGTEVQIPSGIRYAFVSNFATRQDPTSTPIRKWLEAMGRQKRIKAGGRLEFLA